MKYQSTKKTTFKNVYNNFKKVTSLKNLWNDCKKFKINKGSDCVNLIDFLLQMCNNEDVQKQYNEQEWIHKNKYECLQDFLLDFNLKDYYNTLQERRYGNYILKKFYVNDQYVIYVIYYQNKVIYTSLDCMECYFTTLNIYQHTSNIIYITERYEDVQKLYLFENGEKTVFDMQTI